MFKIRKTDKKAFKSDFRVITTNFAICRLQYFRSILIVLDFIII